MCEDQGVGVGLLKCVKVQRAYSSINVAAEENIEQFYTPWNVSHAKVI